MGTSQICIMIAIGLYLIGMLIVGAACSKNNNTADDFYIGGRRLGPIVTAMSAEASDMSSWLLMGLPGVAYATGICDASWTAIGLAVGTYANWLIVAKKIRRYSHVTNSITIPDFFSNRYRDKSNVIMIISAIVILVFFIPYTASGFAACGKLFSSLFGVDYMTAMIVSAVIIVGYTALGGFLAASTTDLIQSIVMSIALIVVFIFGIKVAGGMDAVLDNAKNITGYLSLNTMYDPATNTAVEYGFISKVSTFAWGLGYFGMPHVLLRFMAINDHNKLTLSRRIATVWVVISLAMAIFIGVVGLAMTNAGAVNYLEGSSAAETIIVEISALLSTYGIIPALLAGIILAGILASTMSTADSQLIAASSAVSKNIFGIFNKDDSPKRTMALARTTLLVISVIAAIIARNPNSSVFNIVSFAWAGFGGAFGPIMLFSLFWRRTTREGAISGMISGGVMVFVWKYCVKPMGGFWNIYELLPAFIVASIVIVVVSLLTKEPSKEIIEEFDKVKSETNFV